MCRLQLTYINSLIIRISYDLVFFLRTLTMTTCETLLPYIQWNESMEMGFAELDTQHQLLVRLFNLLVKANCELKDNELTLEQLQLFISHCRMHFAVEESLMRVVGYEDFKEHQLHHQLLIRQILQLQANIEEQLEEPEEQNPEELMAMNSQQLLFLQRWLVKHMINDDPEMMPYFQKAKLRMKYNNADWLEDLWQLD